MTSREYLEYIAACTNYQGDVKRRVNEVLDIVGLTKAADRRAKGYSRGMTQRLGMGAAIIGDPELLIFDEPTSALDPEGRAEVISIIERLKSMGSTIVLSTHILSDVERVANRIGIMTNGRLAEEGYLTDILRKHGGVTHHHQLGALEILGRGRVKTGLHNGVQILLFQRLRAECTDTAALFQNL